MPERVARYKLEIDQPSAKQEAHKLAQTFTNELNSAQKQMASAGGSLSGGTSGMGGIGSALLGGVAGYLTVQGVRQIVTGTEALSQSYVAITRATQAFTALSGSSAEAEKRLQAIQRASGGTIDKMSAMSLANRLVALGMAKSSAEMESAVETGRKIATVMGGDVQGALENLSLAAANLSYMRLDQMGISATKVRDRVKELTEADAGLGKEQAFLQAAMETANTTFKDIDVQAAVSGVDRLTTSVGNLKSATEGGWLGKMANTVTNSAADVVNVVSGQTDWFKEQESQLKSIAAKENIVNTRDDAAQGIAQSIMAARDQLATALDAGIPGVEKYKESLFDLSKSFLHTGEWTAQQAIELGNIQFVLQSVTNSTSGYSTAVKLLGDELAKANPTAQAILAQIVQLDAMLASGTITFGAYTQAVDGLTIGLQALKDQADATTDALGATFRQQVLTAQGYKLDAQGNQIRDPRTGEFVRQSWAPDYNPATNSGQQQLEYEHQVAEDRKRADEQAAREWQSAAEQTQREMEAAADQLVSEFKSKLDQIPGLMSTTSVTQDDMDAAAAGVYAMKPDEWLRELKDEVVNGKDYANVDIHDAARRAGLNENLDPKAIYAQVASMWGDQSLFAGGKNLDLINSDAVMDALTRQDKSASGRDAIYKLFGIAPDKATTQALASGLSGGANVDPALANGVATSMGLDPAAAIAALQAGFNSDETIKNLKDIGAGVADHIYAGFASGVGEQDWASPVLASLEGRLVAATVAAISTQMQQP